MHLLNPNNYWLPEGLEQKFEEIFSIFRKDFSLGEYSVELCLLDEEKIRQLNFQYRGKDRMTDVLSFPLSTIPSERFLGAIYFCYPFIKKHCQDLFKELCFLLIHSHLHLLGYEHGDEMFDLQKKIFNSVF